mgnify:CR=1 FL=1
MKRLVTYFSASGVTKRAAEQLAQERPRPKERIQEVAHADR